MNVIRYGEKFFDELEVQTLHRKEISAKAELNQISSSTSSNLGMSVIRGVKNGKIGISIIDSTEEEKIKRGIERAAKLAMVNKKDEKWPGLPEPGNYHKKDERTGEMGEEDYFVNLITLALKDISERKKDAMVVGAEAGSIYVKTQIVNSNGIDVSQEDSVSMFVLVLMARHGESVTPSIFDLDVTKNPKIDTTKVIDSCLTKLEHAKKVKKADLKEAPVIMEPFALGEILQYALLPAFNGERKVKGTSILGDKLGEKVMDEKIKMIDDPFHEKSVAKLIADDEGVPTRKNTIIEKGVFKGFLWNHYWGKIAGEESTGNGMRSFRTGAMGIGAINLVIEEGKRKVEDIIGDVKNGYIVSSFQGAHSSNPDTGTVAAVANPAFVIEDGEITGSTVFMLSGNVYDLMNSVGEISNDAKPVYMISRGMYPHTLFENVKIAPVTR